MKPQCQTVYIQITGNKKGYKGFLVFLTTLLNGNMWKLMGGKKKKKKHKINFYNMWADFSKALREAL